MHARKTLPVIMVALVAAVALYACGGSGGGGGSAGMATVSGYVTDDLAGYDSVEFTLNSVQLRHTGGRSCTIIQGPLQIDAAELGHDQIVERVDTTTCEAGPYNRLHVELDDDVTLRQTVNGQTDTKACKFVSYYDDSMRPNRLACANGTCSLDITGAVNLVAGSHEHVALDADLKQFTVVDTSLTTCEVTLKVSPLHAENKLAAGFLMSLTGTVSALDTAADRFTLTVRGRPFTVLYAGIIDQAGLEALLARAATDGLRTRVRCQSIDNSTTPPTCTAQTDPAQPRKAITVKAEGAISALDEVMKTFTLNYGAGTTLPANYANATVEGTLADAATAEVKFYGFDASFFLAREAEVK